MDLLDGRGAPDAPSGQTLAVYWDFELDRRLEEDIGSIQAGFPRRAVDPIVISDLLDDAPELQRFRLLSSIEAFACALNADRATVELQRASAEAGDGASALQQKEQALLDRRVLVSTENRYGINSSIPTSSARVRRDIFPRLPERPGRVASAEITGSGVPPSSMNQYGCSAYERSRADHGSGGRDRITPRARIEAPDGARAEGPSRRATPFSSAADLLRKFSRRVPPAFWWSTPWRRSA